MADESKGNQEKSISDELSSILDQLSTDQIRFVVARQECATDKEAAEAIGIKPDTVYHWPDAVKDAVRLMAHDGIIVARNVRRRNLAKAMLIKVAGLDSEDERMRQGVATEIIEWEMGKATQPTEHSGPGGGPIETDAKTRIEIDAQDELREFLQALADAGFTGAALDQLHTAQTDAEAEALSAADDA